MKKFCFSKSMMQVIITILLITIFIPSTSLSPVVFSKQNVKKKLEIIPINDSTLIQIIQNSKKLKLLHIFGLWCEGQKLGFKTILDTYTKSKNNIEFILVLTDIYTPIQLSILARKFGRSVDKPIYVFSVNQDLSYENVDQFINEKPHKIKELLNKIDSTTLVNFSLPYTCIIDEHGKIIKSIHPLKVFDSETLSKIKGSKAKKLYKKKLEEFLNQFGM